MTGQIMNVMKSTAAVHLLTVQKPKLNNKDEDSIPAAHREEKVPYPVEKWTDTAYAKKTALTSNAKELNYLSRS